MLKLLRVRIIQILQIFSDNFSTDSEDSLFDGEENGDGSEDENEPIEIPWVEETEVSRRVETPEDEDFPDTESIRYQIK